MGKCWNSTTFTQVDTIKGDSKDLPLMGHPYMGSSSTKAQEMHTKHPASFNVVSHLELLVGSLMSSTAISELMFFTFSAFNPFLVKAGPSNSPNWRNSQGDQSCCYPQGWSCSHCPGGFSENLLDTIPSNNQKKGPPMGKDGQFTNKTTSRTTVRDRPTNWKRINDSLLPKVQQVFGNLFMFNSLLNFGRNWVEKSPTQDAGASLTRMTLININ